jgi:hypothetical protein
MNSKQKEIIKNTPENKNEPEKIESLSIKEQMLGVKSTKPLPKDFYEKILECEMSLKEKFDMGILGTLIQYYSLAVEHFGSLGDDKKCAEYNENLNLLFKQIEVKKYMDEGNNIESNAKKDEVKQEMHVAEQKITKSAVKSILKNKEKKQTKSGKSVVLKEIFNQTMNFKKKLEEKKKKYKLKLNLENINTSIIPKAQKSKKKLPSILRNKTEKNMIVTKKVSRSTKNKKSKNAFEEMFYDLEFPKAQNSFRFPKYKNIFDLFEKKKNENKSILNMNDISNEESNKNLLDLKNKIVINDNSLINKDEINDNTNDDDDELILSLESNPYDDNSSDIKLNLPSKSTKTLPYLYKTDKIKDISTKITKKSNFQIIIKQNLSEYIEGYLDYFMDNIADKIVNDYEKSSYDVSKELISEELNYFNQERQMEFLNDEDDTYKNQITDILDGLKTEAEDKKNEILSKYDKKLNNINDKYSLNNHIFGCHEIEMLKEQLKLDITKEINNCIFK